MSEIWYRYEDYLTSAGVDEWENPLEPPNVNIRLRKYEVEKSTPKGVWLRETFGAFRADDRRFVLRESHKHFACPSIEEAKASFRARKAKQIRLYSLRIRHAEEALIKLDPAESLHLLTI